METHAAWWRRAELAAGTVGGTDTIRSRRRHAADHERMNSVLSYSDKAGVTLPAARVQLDARAEWRVHICRWRAVRTSPRMVPAASRARLSQICENQKMHCTDQTLHSQKPGSA
eukprot:jgi/Ulvmu1/12212/UM086_0001.1